MPKRSPQSLGLDDDFLKYSLPEKYCRTIHWAGGCFETNNDSMHDMKVNDISKDHSH